MYNSACKPAEKLVAGYQSVKDGTDTKKECREWTWLSLMWRDIRWNWVEEELGSAELGVVMKKVGEDYGYQALDRRMCGATRCCSYELKDQV